MFDLLVGRTECVRWRTEFDGTSGDSSAIPSDEHAVALRLLPPLFKDSDFADGRVISVAA